MRPAMGGGATPRLPKNGRRGISIPGPNSATFLYAGAVGGERDCIVIGTKPGIYGAGVAFGVGGFESFVRTRAAVWAKSRAWRV